jgi:LysR family transcriptional activator of nhaA
MRGGVKIECIEGAPEELLLKLAANELDLVLAETPAYSAFRRRLFNHLLGSSDLALFAAQPLSRFYRRGFPKSLTGAPFLLPIRKSALRQALDDWFEAESITPRVLGEFQDTALIDVFAQSGAGIFAAPVAIEREIRTSYHVVKLGILSNHTVSYYAISGERKIKHPAVTVIAEAAQTRLFSGAPA